jgi:hypothetical protein
LIYLNLINTIIYMKSKEFDPSHVNQDRVTSSLSTHVTLTEISPEVREYAHRVVLDGYKYRPDWSMGLSFKRSATVAAATSALLGLPANLLKEQENLSPSLQSTKGFLEEDMNSIGIRAKTDLIKNICEWADA